MAKHCSICTHPARETIDSSLVRRVPYAKISERFGVATGTLSKHLNEHLAAHVQQALTEYGTSKGIKVLTKLSTLVDRLGSFLDRAEEAGDSPEFRATAAELRKQLELVAKLQGDLDQEGTTHINLQLNVGWIELRSAILLALEAHPEARGDVLRALEGVGNGRG